MGPPPRRTGRRARATRVATEEGLQSPAAEPEQHGRWQLARSSVFCALSGFGLGVGLVLFVATSGSAMLEAGMIAVSVGLTSSAPDGSDARTTVTSTEPHDVPALESVAAPTAAPRKPGGALWTSATPVSHSAASLPPAPSGPASPDALVRLSAALAALTSPPYHRLRRNNNLHRAHRPRCLRRRNRLSSHLPQHLPLPQFRRRFRSPLRPS